MAIEVKICGLKTPAAVDAAVAGGARLVGFVFFPPSPRALSPAAAAELVRRVPAGVGTVGLFVDPDDALLEATLAAVPLGLLQLHGRETPQRVAAIRRTTGLPVMKVFSVATAEDLASVGAYDAVADRLMFDAKAPKHATRPGGNAVAFDWTILAGRRFARPWMLAGGLNTGNLAEAVRTTGAVAVDVSSGVESRPGQKDPALIAAFLEAAARLA